MTFLKVICLSVIGLASSHIIRSDAVGRTVPASHGDWCGTRNIPKGLKKEFGGGGNPSWNVTHSSLVVDTYIHVVASGTSVADGYLDDETISRQVAVLGSTYAPTGVSFKLLGVNRVINALWATSVSPADHLAMKKALRQGSYKTLNLYYRPVVGVSSTGGTLLGLCPFPDAVTPGSDGFYDDGCMILSSTVPGGTMEDANLGITTTHEVGHWFGLFHTFHEGCFVGDQVADTPAERVPSYDCAAKDTCPDQPGLDPINNYMDYSPDACLSEFTHGQRVRLYEVWQLFRS